MTIEFERATAFSFSSVVEWPAGDNYDSVVEQAVRNALESLRLQMAFSCRLLAIEWHDIDSCAAGFAFAAAHATRVALEEIA